MDQISFRLNPLPPFDLRFTAWALRRRPEDIVDRWDGQTYRRVLVLEGDPVETEVAQIGLAERPILQVAVTYRKKIPNLKSRVTLALERMLGGSN